MPNTVAVVIPNAHYLTEIVLLDEDGNVVDHETPIPWTGKMLKLEVDASAGEKLTAQYRAENVYGKDLGWSAEMSPALVTHEPSTVPEPGLTASLIVGGLFLAWAGKRRTKR